MKNSFFQCITIYHYIIISIFLFITGLIGIIISRTFIKLLISSEFIINSINLILISFASYKIDTTNLGYTIVLFTTGISAIIMAVCLYFSHHAYSKFNTIDITKIYKQYGDKG